jgi:hypothetical protein
MPVPNTLTIHASILPLPTGISPQQYLAARNIVQANFDSVVNSSRVLQSQDLSRESGGNPGAYERFLREDRAAIRQSLNPQTAEARTQVQQATGLTAAQLQRVSQLITVEAELNGGDIANGRTNQVRVLPPGMQAAVAAVSVVGGLGGMTTLASASATGTQLPEGIRFPTQNRPGTQTSPVIPRR